MYSATVLDHFHRPRNAGTVEGATHRGGAGTPGERPYMLICLKVQNGIIERAGFTTYGCPGAVACGSLTTELVTGRSVDIAGRIEANDLMTLLGGLPAGKEHCAELGVTALRNALSMEGAGGLSDG